MDRLSTIVSQFKSVGSTEICESVIESFASLFELVASGVTDSSACHEIEENVYEKVREIGLRMIQLAFSEVGDGDQGEQISHPEHGSLIRSKLRNSSYQSVFGEFTYSHFTYSKRVRQKAIEKPVAKALQLPAHKQSYFLESILQQFVVLGPYGEAVLAVKRLLGLKTSVRAAERMNRDLANSVANFTGSKESACEEEEILVASADGKGVVVRQSLNEQKQEELGQKGYQPATDGSSKRTPVGANKSKKQAAYVGTVYSIAPHVRSVEDILGDVKPPSDKRPRPVNKKLFVEMTTIGENGLTEGPDKVFTQISQQVADRRKPKQTLVVIMDGQRSLWYQQLQHLKEAVAILDFWHVTEYVWTAAHSLYKKRADQEKFVNRQLKRLLEGKVKGVITTLKRKRSGLGESKLKELNKTIRYFQTNIDRMKYDEYLAAGYPIGSGVIEGACRHLVKDRMERSGMRWRSDLALNMLKLRAININGDWKPMMNFRIQAENKRLYGMAT